VARDTNLPGRFVFTVVCARRTVEIAMRHLRALWRVLWMYWGRWNEVV
jgi:hypothetical protein